MSEILTNSNSGISSVEEPLPNEKTRLRRLINTRLQKTVLPRTVERIIQAQKQQVQQNGCVLHPYSYIRIAWEAIIIILSIVTLIVLPISVAFYKDLDYLKWTISNVVFDAIFLGDVAINFRTGFEDRSQFTLVMEKRPIVRRYLRRWFVFDILSSMPMDMLYYLTKKTNAPLSSVQLSICKCLSMVRILRLVRLCRYANKLESFMEFSGIYFRILNLLVLVFLISHWVGCIQFLAITMENYPNGSWVDLSNIRDSTIFEQYTHSMFKSLSQFIAVGYGSITPTQVTDIILTMLTCSMGSFFYATFIGLLGAIIMSVGSRQREFQHKLAGVHDFLEYKNVPKHLERKIMKYYKFSYPSHFFNDRQILQELSPPLRKELLLATYQPLVNTVPFLTNLRTSILYRIVQYLHHEIFLPGDLILEEGTESPGIFFLYRGTVDVLDKQNSFITRMRSGSYFGDISILIKKPNDTNVVAYQTTEVYILPSADFKAIVKSYPESFESLYEDAEERNNKLQTILLNASQIHKNGGGVIQANELDFRPKH